MKPLAMITSATEGNSPAAAFDPPTMAIDGVAAKARAAHAVASASESVRKPGMRAATRRAAKTCGPAGYCGSAVTSPGPGAATNVVSTSRSENSNSLEPTTTERENDEPVVP